MFLIFKQFDVAFIWHLVHSTDMQRLRMVLTLFWWNIFLRLFYKLIILLLMINLDECLLFELECDDWSCICDLRKSKIEWSRHEMVSNYSEITGYCNRIIIYNTFFCSWMTNFKMSLMPLTITMMTMREMAFLT